MGRGIGIVAGKGVMTGPFHPEAAAAALLATVNRPPPEALTRLPGGRNNQVWRVDGAGGPVLLKRYYWDERDRRDRLGQEWQFLSYLRRIGCRAAPEPVACDRPSRCALMEFVDGMPVGHDEVGVFEITSAAAFFHEMNSQRQSADDLPPVSEACFSLQDHLAVAAGRVARLQTIAGGAPAQDDARRMVAELIAPLWSTIEARILASAPAPLDAPLPAEERCLSPSDFGFHNALRQADGRLRFLDFEYAGWDDPAKTIIDFCNQPDGLIPRHLAESFRSRALEVVPDRDSLARRINLLEPLYQLKWACICLNGFLPGRGFNETRPDRSPEAQLAKALVMARRAAESLDAGCNSP